MKIALIGMADQGQAFDVPEGYTIWGMGHSAWLPHYDVGFEIHPSEDYLRWKSKAKLDQARIPIYMQAHDPEIKESVPYPLDAAISVLGRDYFCSTGAYMLTAAILAEPEEIVIWGHTGADDGAWKDQRTNLEYILGIAQGRGIPVEIHGEHQFFDVSGHHNAGKYPVRYGWE